MLIPCGVDWVAWANALLINTEFLQLLLVRRGSTARAAAG
jgi:hypothetical protein